MQMLRAYLQLMRFPAVFTAMADIFLGFLLTHHTLEPASKFGLLLGASSCLYLSGMVLNDLFDRHIDARERPSRPLPSGRVSVRSAALLGGTLMAAGCVLAGFVGPSSLKISLALAGAVLLYDGLLKNTPLGPVAMGSCRFLNVMLGASAEFFVWTRPQLYAASALGIYIVGVTWFARREVERSNRISLAAAATAINLGLAGMAAFVAVWQGEAHWPGELEPNPSIVYVLLAMIALAVDRHVARALIDPSGAKVQQAVKGALMSLILLDATLVFFKTGRADLAIATAALVIPSLVLARWLYVT